MQYSFDITTTNYKQFSLPETVSVEYVYMDAESHFSVAGIMHRLFFIWRWRFDISQILIFIYF